MPNLADLQIRQIREQTCPRCSRTLPLTEDNFFHRRRANGAIWVDARCQPCRREVDRENRRARAAGNQVRPIRASRRVSTRKFGVEIELIVSDQRTLAREIRSRGLSCSVEGYNHLVRDGWKIVTDASLPAGGAELVSPPLSGENGFEQVRKVCEAIDAVGGRVNRSCGLHVHHEVRDLNADAFGRLARGWMRNQPNTNWLVAASRRDSQWARPLNEGQVSRIERLQSLDSDSIRRLFNSYSFSRYHALNVTCFPRYGTVEIRQHQGSINAAKIEAWVLYGQAFIAAAVAGEIDQMPSTGALLDSLAAQGHLAAETATYLKGRADHFTGRVAVAA